MLTTTYYPATALTLLITERYILGISSNSAMLACGLITCCAILWGLNEKKCFHLVQKCFKVIPVGK